MNQVRDTPLKLTKNKIIFIFVYNFVVFISGNILAIAIIILSTKESTNPPNILKLSLIGSIGMSSLGCSIYYIRKLYKSCINGNLVVDNDESSMLIRIGTFIYYLARPLFSIGFSILIVIGLLTGFLAISLKNVELNSGFIYLTMFLSFFIGFQVGKFVKRLEAESEKIFDKLIKE